MNHLTALAHYLEKATRAARDAAEIASTELVTTPQVGDVITSEHEYDALPLGSIIAPAGNKPYVRTVHPEWGKYEGWYRGDTFSSSRTLESVGIVSTVLRVGWGE